MTFVLRYGVCGPITFILVLFSIEMKAFQLSACALDDLWQGSVAAERTDHTHSGVSAVVSITKQRLTGHITHAGLFPQNVNLVYHQL